MIKYLKH